MINQNGPSPLIKRLANFIALRHGLYDSNLPKIYYENALGYLVDLILDKHELKPWCDYAYDGSTWPCEITEAKNTLELYIRPFLARVAAQYINIIMSGCFNQIRIIVIKAQQIYVI